MKRNKPLYLFILLLLAWFLINIIQATFTEITYDEAYYALWGRMLDWGYYDHPPMIAVFTHFSSLLFPGNLGVRFFTAIIQLFTLILIWKIAGVKMDLNKSVLRFFIISASVVMFCAYGFITTPDVPLLFFAALFLYSYKRFLNEENIFNTLILSLSMIGMLYSKYHGVLLIALVVLSNPKLVLKAKFLLSLFITLICLIPHIRWQIQHDFPALQYHLVDRSSAFSWKYFLEYLPNQLFVFNPFTFIAAVWVMIIKKKLNLFDRALYFIILGFIAFFWIMSVRGHVEPHWTIIAAIPMIVLIVRESVVNVFIQRYIARFVLPSLFLVTFVRVLLVTDVLPHRLALNGKKEKYIALHEIAKDSPVIMRGSFQHASLYRFFTKGKTQLISSLYTRKTQFDIWKFEDDFYDKTVLITGDYNGRSTLLSNINETRFVGFFTDSLQITNDLEIDYQLNANNFNSGDSIILPVRIKNNSIRDYEIHHSVFPGEIIAILIKDDKLIEIPTIYKIPDIIYSDEEYSTDLKFNVPDIGKGKYQFTISFKSWFGPTLNSPVVSVVI
jgi:hypothetical protein